MTEAESPAPRASVVIPTHNRAAFLRQAVRSVLAQTVTDLELIVVDDGSTDDTAAAVAELQGDPRLRYVYQPNQGRSAARNHGARLARGEFLGFLDSDDRYLPTALEAHLAVFAGRPDLGLTLGGYQYGDDEGRSLGERRPWELGGRLDAAGWLFDCYGMPGSVLLWRAWFERVGGFDPACEIAEDWDLFLRLAHAGCPMAWVRQVVCDYRQHSGSSVHAVTTHRDGAVHMLDKFFAQPGLPPDLAALQNRARAWVHVVFARRAFALGLPELAGRELQAALALEPAFAGARKLELLEFLAMPDPMAPAGWGERLAGLANHLPSGLRVSPGDLRRATARSEMAQFFQAIGRRAEAEAAGYLQAALKRDPRWLANRGVLAFGLRRARQRLAGRLSSRPASNDRTEHGPG